MLQNFHEQDRSNGLRAPASKSESRRVMADRDKIIEKIRALLSKTVENGATEAEMLSAPTWRGRGWIRTKSPTRTCS